MIGNEGCVNLHGWRGWKGYWFGRGRFQTCPYGGRTFPLFSRGNNPSILPIPQIRVQITYSPFACVRGLGGCARNDDGWCVNLHGWTGWKGYWVGRGRFQTCPYGERTSSPPSADAIILQSFQSLKSGFRQRVPLRLRKGVREMLSLTLLR